LQRALLKQQEESNLRAAALKRAEFEFKQAQREQVGIRFDMFADLRAQITEQRKQVQSAEVRPGLDLVFPDYAY
jgi:hypothetical protein